MPGESELRRSRREPAPSPDDEASSHTEDLEPDTAEEPSLFAQPKKLLQTFAAVLLIVIAIYLLLPELVGVDDALSVLGGGDGVWLTVSFLFVFPMFFSYVALFRGVVGKRRGRLSWSESYEITMAGLAATRLFSAGGAGGIILTYWALRRAGMPRKVSAARMVAFLVLLYAVYMLALVVAGVLLRTEVLAGPHPVGLTVVPAGLAGAVILIFLLIALVPGDLERSFSEASQRRLSGRLGRRLATVPSTAAMGVRSAIAFVRTPSQGAPAIVGAIGFWAANVGILWAAFHAFDVQVPLGVVVQGFFVGMTANLLPFAPGGVGAVDAGMIGAFVLFGLPSSTVFAAVLTYRLIAFWLPIPPGVVAFFQLRQTVARWEADQRSGRSALGPLGEVPAGPEDVTTKSEV